MEVGGNGGIVAVRALPQATASAWSLTDTSGLKEGSSNGAEGLTFNRKVKGVGIEKI